MNEINNPETNLNNNSQPAQQPTQQPTPQSAPQPTQQPISQPVNQQAPVNAPAQPTPVRGQYIYQQPTVQNPQQTVSARPQYQGYQTPGAYTYQSRAYAAAPNAQQQAAAAPPFAASQLQKQDKTKRSFSVLTLIICIVASIVLSTTVSSAVTVYIMENTDESGQSAPIADGGTSNNHTNTTITNTTENYVEAVAEKVQPSVVGIVVKYKQGYFGSSQQQSQGSGVIYTSDGYIITNKHVISQAITSGSVYVYLHGDLDTSYEATIVGYDSSCDLAVLKINGVNLPAIEVGSSADLKVGQNAVAVGNPGGLELMGSVSVGYISGLNRKLTVDSTTMTLIQTDSAINPGNSGGALVDKEGKLIGITNAKIVSEQFEGLGFAIPVDTVTEICDRIIAGKDESKPYIGVQIDTSYTEEFLKKYNLPAGAVVGSVIEGGPADTAGIRRNDIIVSVGDSTVTNYDTLVSALKNYKVGDTITVRVYRDSKYHDCRVTLSANG